MKKLATIAALSVVFAAGCKGGDPPPDYFTSIEYLVDSSARSRLIAEIEGATERLDVAVTGLKNIEIADAIIAAHKRGVKVRVVTDADSAGDSGIRALAEADLAITYGDGSLLYLPEPTLASLVDDCGISDGIVRCPPPPGAEDLPDDARTAMYRPGSFNLMSHNFFIIDTRTIWNFAQAFDAVDGPEFGFRAESERMREVFVREFNQLFSGVFAVTLDVYNGPVKSLSQYNPDFNAQSYLTDRGELEVRFNPQDRLTKTIIDDIYRAKASVYLVTDNLAEDFVIDALRYKASARRPGSAEDAFEVRIIVNSAAQTDLTREQVESLGDVVRYAPADIERLPTMVLFDAVPDVDGEDRPRRVHIATQPLWRVSPFDVLTPGRENPLCPPSQSNADCVVVYPSGYFLDGNMWSLLEYRGQIGGVAEIDALETFFNDLWTASSEP